jgi:uncharacterized RDD family membrane protein YckC
MMVASVPAVALLDDAIDPGNVYYQVALVAIAVIFFAGFWSNSGQTPGMRAWRLRVLQRDGTPARFNQGVLRFLYAGVSVLAAGCGFWGMLFDADKLTWHDRWSGTTVLLQPKQNRKN